MSTSCKPALDPEAQVGAFPYTDLPTTNPMAALAGSQPNSGTSARNQNDVDVARKEGEAAARIWFEQQVEQMRNHLSTAITEFAKERASYYERVEKEVVQLALSIARKILRREAQIDPLLLAGMVRVALEKIESGTKVSVCVHPQQVSECRAYFAQHLPAREVPEVIEDPALPLHHCVVKTTLGTTDIGPEVQLKEIEQGFLDLLGQRPPVTA